jgi:prepilin-type N-terminal cleavage/methylation domain-containing protein
MRRLRRGLTLVELLIASTVMAMIVGAMSALALTAQTSHDAAGREWTVAQHARVTLGRIEGAVLAARASEQFPGAVVVATSEASISFPETLVVWNGGVAAADPSGLPRWRELAIYCPNPATPNELLEITTSDATAVPKLSDTAAWSSALAAIKASAQSRRVVLTNRLRTARLSGGQLRGAARFFVRLRPSANEWQDFRDGDIAFEDLAWPHCAPGAETGMRQTWCAIELQMHPGAIPGAGQATSREIAIPFFGSSALYTPLER